MASAEPTIVNVCSLPVSSSSTLTTEPTWTTSVVRSFASIDGRRAQLLLDGGDALLEHRLLVLRVVVLGVLRDVAELARLLDALSDLAALVGLEVGQLHLELLEAFGGEDDVLGHGPKPSDRGSGARQCNSASAGLREGQAASGDRRAQPGQDGRAPRRATRSRCSASLSVAVLAEALDVPGVELAQVAGGALLARGARPRGRSPSPARRGPPRGVGSSSPRRPSRRAKSHGLPSAPRASITASQPVALEGGGDRVGVAHPAGEDHRARAACATSSAASSRSGAPLWCTWAERGWKPMAGDAGLVDEAVRELEAVRVAALATGPAA